MRLPNAPQGTRLSRDAQLLCEPTIRGVLVGLTRLQVLADGQVPAESANAQREGKSERKGNVRRISAHQFGQMSFSADLRCSSSWSSAVNTRIFTAR